MCNKTHMRESIAKDWSSASYYDIAEEKQHIDIFWGKFSPFMHLFSFLDCTNIVELACGHGRHVPYYIDKSKAITLIDVNETNISFCRQRFSDKENITYSTNTGNDFAMIGDGAVSAVFCYDAMVHFELSDIIDYLNDSYRILQKGGKILFHHSNYSATPGRIYKENPHWRNFNSAEIFAHFAMRAGFLIMNQNVVSWGHTHCLDCISLCQKL